MLENTLNIFTDGSSRGSPRAGGIGVRFVVVDSSGKEQVQDFEFAGYKSATNNQMELHACIVGLKEAMKVKGDLPPNVTRVVIHSDSLYVVDNYKRAMFEWSRTRWLTRSGRPVLNPELWKQLVKCIQNIGIPLEIRWIKGHSKSEHNRAVDKLARISSKRSFNKPLTHVNVRRKKTDKMVDVGSVEMNGQRITIRVITSEYLSVQRLWKYRYEVISQRCKYRGNVDFIFSEHFLGPGHTYYVRVNSNTSNPRIEKVFREIKPQNSNN
jgi:ribonuclease HI